MAHPDLDEEVFRSLAARIVLADKHLLAAGLILGGLRRILPAPALHNAQAAQADLEAKWRELPEAHHLPSLGASPE